MKRVLSVLVMCAMAMMLVFSGCEKEGPAEKAGGKIDEAVEKAGDKLEQAGDKMEQAAEKAGDKLEDAGDKMEEATEKATD